MVLLANVLQSILQKYYKESKLRFLVFVLWLITLKITFANSIRILSRPQIRHRFPQLKLIWVDGGYDFLNTLSNENIKISIEIEENSDELWISDPIG